jgi:hypothetical protein
MTGKNVLYAAVGAPVVAARRVAEAVSELRSTLNKEADTVGKTANKRVALWADEGEKLVNRITDAKMVDELTSKVDFEQVSSQVSKLRDQLEDMLATWRSSFRPEKLPTIQMEASVDGVKIETKSPVARKATAQKSPTKKSVAKESVAKSSAQKKSSQTKSSQKKSSQKASSQKAVAKKAPAKAKTVASKAPSTQKISARKAATKPSGTRKANSTTRKPATIAS